jgi:hypothetical protein
MTLIELPTDTGPIWINPDHIIFIRPRPRHADQSLIEITNPTADEVGYIFVNTPPRTIVQLITMVRQNES